MFAQPLAVYISGSTANRSAIIQTSINSFNDTYNSTYYYLVRNGPFALNLTSRFVAENVGYLIGTRIRQLRMPAHMCQLPEYLLQYFHACIDEYNGAAEDVGNYPIGWNQAAAPYIYANSNVNISEFTYCSAGILDGEAEQMILGTYHGGGYIGDFGASLSSAVNEIAKLYNTQWVELQSRNVIIEILLLNPTTELFSCVQIAFEFFAGGNILFWSQIISVTLNEYSGSNSIPIIISQIICLVFFIFYSIRGVIAIIKQRLYYFTV